MGGDADRRVDGQDLRGLALQLRPKEINEVMTGKRGWEKDGLGKTGRPI